MRTAKRSTAASRSSGIVMSRAPYGRGVGAHQDSSGFNDIRVAYGPDVIEVGDIMVAGGSWTTGPQGVEHVEPGSYTTDDAIDYGGRKLSPARPPSNAATVNDGGLQLLQAGATASGTRLNDPGVEVVSAGATAIDTTVNGGEQIVYESANITESMPAVSRSWRTAARRMPPRSTPVACWWPMAAPISRARRSRPAPRSSLCRPRPRDLLSRRTRPSRRFAGGRVTGGNLSGHRQRDDVRNLRTAADAASESGDRAPWAENPLRRAVRRPPRRGGTVVAGSGGSRPGDGAAFAGRARTGGRSGPAYRRRDMADRTDRRSGMAVTHSCCRPACCHEATRPRGWCPERRGRATDGPRSAMAAFWV